jgi:di/tricarboxylate transporter
MSLTSLTTTVAPVLAETAHDSGVNPWYVGIGTFVLLTALMLALLAFGAGRDHS